MPEMTGVSALGPGPQSPAAGLSDRAGEESALRPAEPSISPTTQVLRTLDMMDGPPDPTLRSAVGEGEDLAAPTPAHGTGPGAERREQILDGASVMFAERGYHGASLRDISRSVGISHPGMLHHFSSKPALLDAVIDRLEAHAQGLLDAVEPLSSSPASLLAALGGPWHPAQHQMALLATLSAEIVNPEHPGRYRVARLRLVHEHVLEKILDAYAARDLLAGGTDPAFLARSTFSLLLSLAVREKSVRTLQRSGQIDPVADLQVFLGHYLSA